MEGYKLDGTKFDGPYYLAPVFVVREVSEEYHNGWFFNDCQDGSPDDAHGCFETFEDAVEAKKKYL